MNVAFYCTIKPLSTKHCPKLPKMILHKQKLWLFFSFLTEWRGERFPAHNYATDVQGESKVIIYHRFFEDISAILKAFSIIFFKILQISSFTKKCEKTFVAQPF